MLHKCPTCNKTFDCTERNYSIIEGYVAFNTGLSIRDIQESIKPSNKTCANDEKDIQCIYCQLAVQLGIEWF